jgi:hypothetical protein
MSKVTKCSVCGNSLSLDAKFCPKWETHSEPGTRWIHPSLPGNPVSADEDPQMVAVRQALKQARKFFKATVKEAKKKKP